jgi:RimJ/RimL family protein N-acetyltransferase
MSEPPYPPPRRVTLTGQYARLEPLGPSHARDLYEASSDPQAVERHRYIFEEAPTHLGDMVAWCSQVARDPDKLFFAVIDRRTGKAGGRQALMRIEPRHGVIEIGSIYWGPEIARTRISTEALYLTACYVFEELGYRRLEWKCNDLNEASKRAASRFGFSFEGIFHQHMVIKGASRDTAWFAILDHEWPTIRAGYDRWLSETNFDEYGIQKQPLTLALRPQPAARPTPAIASPPAG